MQGLPVQCPQCKRRLFETTEKYNPDISPNGSMVRFLGGYHIDWLTTSATKVSEMACPECQGQLAPSGRLTVIDESKPVSIDNFKQDDGTFKLPIPEEGHEFPEETEVTPKVGKPVHVCDICGKECSTALALNGHKRSHKNKSEAQQ
jgi:uncharacterized protein YbaR (Trm112 family)